jgi:hypothetical protein
VDDDAQLQVRIIIIDHFNLHALEMYAWLLLVEVFFKGVHLECEKNPIHIIHFISYLSAKYLPLFSN